MVKTFILTDVFSPDTEFSTEVKDMQLTEENDRNFEIFSNMIHDFEFSQLLGQIASEAEDRFQNFMYKRDDAGEFEESLNSPDFESKFDGFFEVSYRPLVNGVENEIDRLSQHINQNLKSDTNYEDANKLVESFQVEPEQLFGLDTIINKVKKGVTGVVNVAKDVGAKLVASLSWPNSY